ncbi:prolyl oligopeptidase family serine peptidase [soil metagenome]
MKKIAVFLCLLLLTFTAFGTFYFVNKKTPLSLISLQPSPTPELPLLKYRIEELHQRQYQPSQIVIEKEVKKEASFSSYIFSYQTTSKKMTGLINIPTSPDPQIPLPILIMIRGYIPPATYTSGSGTKSAGEFFAQHGYITIAPDFLGFGGSDPESSDVWEARFLKPIQIVELLKTIQKQTAITLPTESVILDNQHVGIWAHSNGGQIALTALEITSDSVPATLWAPVTAPFPYSILYFSDEETDEGKASRKWINEFDKEYDSFDYSLTQHLNLLNANLQLHQGVADEAIHYIWSDEFVDKIKAESERRKKLAQDNENDTSQSTEATPSAKINASLTPLEITYFKYPNSNHNMQPDWSAIIQRDLDFFDKRLK